MDFVISLKKSLTFLPVSGWQLLYIYLHFRMDDNTNLYISSLHLLRSCAFALYIFRKLRKLVGIYCIPPEQKNLFRIFQRKIMFQIILKVTYLSFGSQIFIQIFFKSEFQPSQVPTNHPTILLYISCLVDLKRIYFYFLLHNK